MLLLYSGATLAETAAARMRPESYILVFSMIGYIYINVLYSHFRDCTR